VADFDCGDEPWEQEVANWIKGPRGSGSALDDMANNGTKVWLYETEADELVGFGSLGVTHWRWDNPKKGQWTPIYIIPFFGVRKTFWEQPPGPKSERYSRRIFEDLLYKAINDPAQYRLLGLMVHQQSGRAIKFYREKFGFADYGTSKEYLRMILDLRGSQSPFPPPSS